MLSDGKTLENYIPFVNIGGGNGGFGVTGRISVDEEGEEEERIDGANEDYYQEGRGSRRTKFKFEKAILNLGRWGTYTFPPVGEGWFDTIYLDKGTLSLLLLLLHVHELCNRDIFVVHFSTMVQTIFFLSVFLRP